MGWWFFAPRLPCIWRPICWRRFFFPKKSTFYKAQPETLPNKPSHRNVARCTVGRHLFRVVLAGGLLLCQFSGSHFPSFFMDPENRTRSSHFLKEHRRNAMLTVHAFGNRVLTADLESSPAPPWGDYFPSFPMMIFARFKVAENLWTFVVAIFFGGMKSFFDKR